jgi:hypothetical protein
MRSKLFPVLLAVLALAAAFPETGSACSCIPPKPRAQFKRADAAFIGRLIRVSPVAFNRAVFEYRVARAYKRRLGRFVRVGSALQSASCGLPDVIGERYAMFLDRQRGRWTSGLCSVTTPADLRRAARSRRSNSAANSRMCREFGIELVTSVTLHTLFTHTPRG